MDRRTRGPRCPQWGRKVGQHSMGGAGVPVGLKWAEKGQNWGLLGWVWHQNDVGWVSWSLPWPKWGKKTQIWALLRCVCHQNDVGWFSLLPIGQNGSKNPKFGRFWGVFSPQIPPVESTFFPLAKMGQKTPKLGTFGVCFPPKPQTLDLPTQPDGSTIFHWPKWVQKPQIWALLRGVFPPNTTSWVSLLPVGQNGSKNPKIGHF